MVIGEISCKAFLPIIYGLDLLSLILMVAGFSIIISIQLIIMKKLKGKNNGK